MNESQQDTFELLSAYCDQWSYDLTEVNDEDSDDPVFLVENNDVNVRLVIDETGDLDTLENPHLITSRGNDLADDVIEGVYELRDEAPEVRF